MLNNFIQAPLNDSVAGIPNSSVNVTSPNVPFPSAAPADYNPTIEYDFRKQNLSDILNDISKKLPDSNILSPVYTSQEQAKRYADSEFYNPMLDNEEIAANNQSWYSKWASGLAKFGTNTLGSFAEGVLQIPDLVAGTRDGNIWKGEWYDSIDTFMNNAEDKFPNYYSKWEKDHPFLSAIPFTGGGANFWADKFTKNLGFAVGAIGSAVFTDLAVAAVTEGIGEIPLIANQIGKASLWLNKIFTGTNRLEEVLNTARALNKSDETILTIKNMANAAAGEKLLNSTRYLTTLGMASNTEAGIEARQSYNQFKQEAIDEYTSKYGVAPTGAELEKIEQYSTSAGNAVYALNMAILSTSNALQFEHILKPWNSYKQDLKKGVESFVKEQSGKIGVKSAKTGEDIGKLSKIEDNSTFVKRAWNTVKPAVPNIFSEGVFEEGGQFAASEGVKQYFKDKYNGKIAGDLNDIVNSIGTGFAKQFGTTEGWENMFIGSLTGMFTSPISNRIERSQRANAGILEPEEATNRVINNLNQKSVTGLFQNNYNSTAQSIKHNEDLNKAIQEDNIFAFKNLKADEFYNFVINGLQNNRADVRKLQLEMLKELSDDELNKLLAIPNGTRESNHAYIDKLIANANQIEKQYNAIGKTFSNPFNYRGNTDKLSEKTKEAAIKENAAWFAFEDYKAALVKMSYNMSDFNQRLNSIQEEIAKINPALTNLLVSNLTNPKSLNDLKVDYKEQANNLSEQLNTIIKRSENPELYNNTVEQVKAFNTYAEQISKFLSTRDSNQLPALFNNLINFESNGRTGKKDNIVDPVYSKDLLNYANDINQINKAKDFASKTYDYLFTQEGYDDFMKNHEEWSNSLSFTEPKQEPKENQIEINGDVYEVGKAYKNKFTPRYTVPTGTTQLKDPFGDVIDTFKTKEEAEAARDLENKNLDENLQDVTFVGYENGRVIVEDSKGQIQYLDSRIFTNFEKALSEEDVVDQNKDFYDTLDADLNKDAVNFPEYMTGEDTLESVLATQGEFEAPKKPKEIVNWSTTYDPTSTKEYYDRQKYFFSEFDKFPQEVKENARVIFVHANNQKALGLDGLVEKMLEGGYAQEYKIDDPAKTPILAVFVKQEGDSFKFLNSKGESISGTSNIDAKRTDIERRRKEALDAQAYQIPIKVETYSIKGDSEDYEAQIRTTQEGKKRLYVDHGNGFQLIDKDININVDNSKILEAFSNADSIQLIKVENKEEYYHNLRQKGFTAKTVEEKINEKYDKELAALGKEPVSDIDAKIAEIERRRDEELLFVKPYNQTLQPVSLDDINNFNNSFKKDGTTIKVYAATNNKSKLLREGFSGEHTGLGTTKGEAKGTIFLTPFLSVALDYANMYAGQRFPLSDIDIVEVELKNGEGVVEGVEIRTRKENIVSVKTLNIEQDSIENIKKEIISNAQKELDALGKEPVSDIEARRQEEINKLDIYGDQIRSFQEISKFGNTLSSALDNIAQKQEQLNNELNRKQKEDTKDRSVRQYTKEELEANPEYQEIKRLDKLVDTINSSVGKPEDFEETVESYINYWVEEKKKAEASRSDKSKIGRINLKYDALGKETSTFDINDIVIATMPIPKLEYRSIEDSPWRNDTSKEFIKKDSENWLNTRKSILANTNKPEMYTFSISNGTAILDQNVDKTLNYHSVSDVLITNRDLSKGNYLKISTGTPINNKNFNKGALVFNNGNTTVKLDNRTFNDEEVNNIYDLLKVFVKQATTGDKKLNKEILNYFMGIMYWQKLEKGANIGNSQVYLNSGYLYIGKKTILPFTVKSIRDNELAIKEAFKNIYVNANNRFVQNNTPFKQLFVDGEGNIKSFTWQSYQHYLISDKYNIDEDDVALYNQKRNINDIPFRTAIKPTSDIINNDVSFINKYAIIGNSVSENAPLAIPVKLEKKAEPVKKQEEPKVEKPAKVNKIDLTGKPENNFKTTYGNIRFGVKRDKSGYNEISIISDEVYKKYIVGLISKPTEDYLTFLEEFDAEPSKETAASYLDDIINSYIEENINKTVKEAPTVKEEKKIDAEITEIKKEEPVKPITPVKENPKEINDLDLGSWNEEAFSLVLDAFNYVEHNLEKSEQWFKDNIPVDFKRLKHLIKTTSNGYAWGRFYNGIAEWYENAKKGTIEHEGFEAIWANYATLKEKEDILKEFNSRKGFFISAETGRKINYSDATEHEAKEELGDELGRYVLDGELYEEPKEGRNKIYQFFKNLLNFVKKLLGIESSKIKQMFDKINTGYYKGGIYVDPKGNNTPEYSIVNLTEADSYNVIRGITYHIVGQLFASNRSLLEFDEIGEHNVESLYRKVYSNMDELFTSKVPEQFMLGKINEVQFAKFQTLWNAIKNDNEHVNKLVQEYLSTFGVKVDLTGLSFSDEEQLVEADHESTESDYGSRRDDSYAINQFKIDAKKTASNSVKLLIATLPETSYIDAEDKTKGTKPKLDTNTLMPQMVNYNRTFNFLLNQLYDLNTWNEKEKKLIELGKDYPNYVALNRRLKIGAKDVDLDTWSLRVKFFNVMSKQRPGAYIHYIGKDEEGKVSSRVRPVNLNALANDIAQSWLDTLKLAYNSPNNVVSLENNEDYTFNGEKLGKNPLKTANDILSYLKGLNIPFTNQMYNRLSKEEKTLLTDIVHKLQSSLKNKKGVVEITPSKLNNAGNFLKIAQLYLRVNEETTSTFYNIDGEKQQQFIGNNFVSQTINDINNSTSKENMYNNLPFMQAPYRSDSQYLTKILFNTEGDRTGKVLSIGYTQGLVDSINEVEVSNSKMIAPVRMIEQINNELKKLYYIMVPADSQTEWMLGMEHILTYDMFYGADINDRIYRIFNKYYQTERNIAPKNENGTIKKDANENSAYKSTMYHADFNTDYSSENLNKNKFISYIDNNVNNLIQYLKDNNIITWNKNYPDKFIIKGLDSEFGKSNSITQDKGKKGFSFTDKELFDFFKFTEVNYMINNIEINKLFFGDTAFIKDPLKRYKSFLSPRELAFYNSEEYNKSLNENLNKAANTIVLNKNDYGYWQHKEYIPTVTVKDIATGDLSILNDRTVEKYHEAYAETNPADGQSWGFLPAYREILYKNGGRFSKEQENLYQYVTAMDRKAMYEDGHLNDNPNSKYYYRPELKKQDEKTIEEGYNGTETFHIIKPIGSGVTLEGEIFLDKTSLAPLSYSLVRGTALEQHYLNMWRQGIGYIIMESGRKLASKDAEDFYFKNGKVNTDKYKTIKNVPHRYYGVQVETEGRHSDGPLGSQLSKLGVVNLRDGGVAKTETIQKMIDRHNEALRNLSEFGYEQLLKKLGIRDYGDRFEVKNKNKVLKLLKEELFKRETPQNLKSSLALDKDGNFKIPLEAMANYQQIKDILYSIVDKLIAKPRMNGGPKIQLSGTGFEKDVRTVKTKNGKEYLVSNGLKFYEAEYDENGNRTRVNRMQVMLPMWFWDKIKNHPRWKNASNEEILKYLNNTQAGQKVLKGIGFRIPTQELNSVEAFEVVGFTPKWMGDMIILPEAITTKSGGDFDVDKLNTYLKNIYLTPDGDIRVIPYYGYGKEARAKFDELDIAAEYGDAEDAIQDILDLESGTMDIYALDKIADKMYAESLQNEYFDSLGDLLLLPENFERLIRPNSAAEGKALRKELEKLAPLEFESGKDKSILNRQYMSNMRHLFLIGKAWVGISASSQTNNALNQSTKVILNSDKIKELSKVERQYIGNGQILLPHNYFVIDGRKVPTLSRTTDAKGEYISDKISRYIDGPVDIAKDPWVTQLFQTTQIFSIALTLEKLGVPDRDVVFFLNQPIIREYIKYLNDLNTSWALNKKNIETILKKFNLKPIKVTIKDGVSFIENPLTITELNTKTFEGNIQKYYNGGKFTQIENEQQKTILYEFLKYSVLSGQLFNMQQALLWDTNPEPDPYRQYRKNKKVEQVRAANIFTDIDDVFNNTQIGAIRKNVTRGSMAIDQSFSIYDNNIRSVIRSVVDELPERGLDYEKAVRGVEDSFLTFILQTNLGINNDIKRLMVDLESNLASKIYYLKLDLQENHSNSDLANNIVLKQIIPIAKNKRNEVKNIKIAQKATDVFTSDVYTNAFRELKANERTRDLYKDIITLSLLQSGLAQSPISFNKYIPYEDYSEAITDILKNIKGAPNINRFAQTGSFFRNSWKNSDVVPNMKEEIKDNGDSANYLRTKWFEALKEERGIADPLYQLYKIDAGKGIARSKYISFDKYMGEDENGNEQYRTILLQRVDDDFGNPVFLPERVNQGVPSLRGNFMYLPINAWGDGMYLQEHYNDLRPSVVNNNALRIATELTTQEVIEAYNNRANINLDNSQKNVIFATVKNHAMYYSMPASENLLGENTTTLELAEKGIRTATTRSYPLGNIGDIITFENRPTQYRITSVEQLTEEKVKNDDWIKQWSEKEQWTPEHFKKVLGGSTVHIGSWQTSFEKINIPEQGTLFVEEVMMNKDITIPLSEATNHSGGAEGGDKMWDSIGREFGVINHKHYRPEDLNKLKAEDKVRIENAYIKAAQMMGRKVLSSDTYAGGLVRRDFLQIIYSDAVFAISKILQPGERDKKGYISKSLQIEGGTGYAVQMGINEGKEVNVFDQIANKWYKWDYNTNSFIEQNTPILTKNFAGIGTREINENGKKAIRDVYEKSSFVRSTVERNKPIEPTQGTLFSATDIDSQIDNLIQEGIVKENCK